MNTKDSTEDDDMPAEIDLSRGVRGLHYAGPDAVLIFPPDAESGPLYLDQGVQKWLRAKAASKGVSVEDIANELLKREIELIEAMK